MRFLTESDHCGAEATDKGLKNRWRWSWLSEQDKDDIDWREWCKKIEIAGMCFCIVCSKAISYGTTGKKSLRLHCEDKKHINNIKCLKKNTTIPGASRTMGQTSFADRVAELRCLVQWARLPLLIVLLNYAV